jgi:hypothetical protein
MVMRKAWLILLVVLVVSLSLFQPEHAEAWKPYTHIYTANQIRADVVDGHVIINERPYRVRPEIVDALRRWPQFYNAGVVGPDGFPDLVYGQSAIHPENTGAWLRHIYNNAWAAQSTLLIPQEQKGQILAFAYGYLTHAAGDMWAHTLVNDFSRGVFPGPGQILTEVDEAEVALRHTILEGYMGDATPGFDGNPDRTQLPNGDISDDSTLGIALDAPHDFIYQTMISPRAGTPTPDRGALVDFFFDLEKSINAEAVRLSADGEHTDCSLLDSDCKKVTITRTANTLRGPTQVQFTAHECRARFICFGLDSADLAEDVKNKIVAGYFKAWVDDIRAGLQQWDRLGLATSKGLFDPQARRNFQNKECANHGRESSLSRAKCESGISTIAVIMDQSNNFINNHLLSMLGAPDLVGGFRAALQTVSGFFSAILGALGIPFNPLESLNQVVEDLFKDAIARKFNIDVDQIEEFVSHPTHWLNVESARITLPQLGTVNVDLFSRDNHARLDKIMGLPEDHHVPSDFPSPGASTRLADTAVVDPNAFAPLKNTITMGKLLMLDGNELNRLLADLLPDVEVVDTYQVRGQVPANVMIDGLALDFIPSTVGDPWLQSIDADHAWRSNRQPIFDRPTDCSSSVEEKDMPLCGGNGRFPIWESCLLRPAFRELFVDWENHRNFPPHGDQASPVNGVLSATNITGQQVFKAENIITAGPNLTIESGANVKLVARSIRLVPGFSAQQGSRFQAKGEDNPCNPGFPTRG